MRNNRYNEFEFVAPTQESHRLMNAYAEQIYRARMAANSNQNMTDVLLRSKLDALTLDMEARHKAWSEKVDIAKAYEENKVLIVNGEEYRQVVARLEDEAAAIRQELSEYAARKQMAAESYTRLADDSDLVAEAQARLEKMEARLADAKKIAETDWRKMSESGSLFMALRPADVKSFAEFKAKHIDVERDKRNVYYNFQNRKVKRNDAIGLDHELVLEENQARKIQNEHKYFVRWEEIPDVVETGEVYNLALQTRSGSFATCFLLDQNKKSLLVLGTMSESKKHGKRIFVEDVIEGDIEKLWLWIKEKEAHLSRGPGDVSQGYPQVDPLSRKASSEKIHNEDHSVNKNILNENSFFSSKEKTGAMSAGIMCLNTTKNFASLKPCQLRITG